jgi:aminopeptidase N
VTSDGATLTVEQQRFTLRPQADDLSRWQVPIVLRAYGADGEHRQRFVLADDRDTIRLDGAATRVILNDGGSGIYRTRYSPELLRALTDDLGSLASLERFTLVSDGLATVQAGVTPVADWLHLVTTIAKIETDPSVWAQVIGGLYWLETVTELDERGRLWAFARQLLGPQLARLGWAPAAGEGELTGTLRAAVIRSLGVLGADEHVRARARELHASYLADRASIDPDVAGAVTTVVATWGTPTDYAEFLRHWRTPATPQEELRYLYSLGEFRDRSLAPRTLEVAMSEVRSQNAPFLIARLLANREAGDLAWTFIKEHWDAILERFPENLVDRMLGGITNHTAAHQTADIKAFLATHNVPSRARMVDQLIEELEVASTFRTASQAELVAALSDR